MTVLASKYLTLVDVAKQTAGDGTIVSDIAEILSVNTAMIQDAHVMECNDGSSHKSAIRHGLPKGTFRKLYGYVPSTKSTVEQVIDVTGMLEDYSSVDVDLVKKSKNPAQLRVNESKAHIEGMGQTAQETLIYGSKTENDAAFDGFAVRYSKKSTDKKEIGYNIIDAGGTGADNTSIWIITFGEGQSALLYPEGSQAGLQHKDLGEQLDKNADGDMRQMFVDHFKHDLGLTIKDWRANCRIANIDISELIAGNVNLLDLLRKGFFRVKKHINTSGAKTFIYCNDTIAEYLDKAATDKANVQLTIKEYCGDDIAHYKNIPIRVLEQILETEAAVS